MGKYVTRPLQAAEYKDIIDCIRNGYLNHKPNEQVATILVLQYNLGCRINDIVHLKVDNFKFDGDAWRLEIREQKTKKPRPYIVPGPVMDFIQEWMDKKNITTGRLFNIEAPAVWKQMRNVCDFLDLENVSTHSLRKAAGIRVYNDSGKDIALVTQFYNHSSPAVSMKYLRRSTKQMDEVLSKSVALI